MAETMNEKTAHDTLSTADSDTPIVRPAGWKYKQFKIGPVTLPWYASPPTQLALIAFVCFMCPGMYNALGGMGGGGQIDPVAADHANVAVYSTFAVIGFFAGSFVNTVGIKVSLAFGGLGYTIYVASMLCYTHTQNQGFTIFAGALLGACAGILWSAQGAIMLAYPPEESKGKYISWFWMIFNMGGVIGSLIPLGQNINTTTNSTVSDGTYIGFIVLTFIGACLALTLVDAKSVIRKDGSKIILMKNPTWQSELLGLWESIRSDPYIICLFPMFFASNWFYTYQFNGVNLARFNTRTRALNNVLYWFSQIIGAFIFGYGLDVQALRRSVRAKIAWIALFVITMVVWGGGFAFQNGIDRDITDVEGYIKMDWTTTGYVGPMFLYIFYGIYDAAWQTCVYWFIGSLTNNSRKIANFAGFYKGIQSTGAAIIWRLDALKIPYMNEFASCWALLAGSLLIAAPVIYVRIKDHVDLEEDLKFSDETKAEVVAHGGTKSADDHELA
ncbi:major facilitator superfamily domain-containing protein [Elsinoe ampelina]|uniref:Major facilitator superfamily domain-containing protein n=1 Tax=Elsinoe ampelina TaxID=302913 RepID=A0A6A6GLL0_9PEZI|nr:major facilitator superfamily domain-containing protein [Elsinoe ampelina]